MFQNRMGPPSAQKPISTAVSKSVKKDTKLEQQVKDITNNPTGKIPPDIKKANKGLSLKGILRHTPKYIKNSSEDIAISSYKPTKTKGGLPAVTGYSYDGTKKPRKKHKFQIIGLEKGKKLSEQKRVKVSCQCEFFMYYSEYALWTWGAANITYSNGEPAVVRNPGNIPLYCVAKGEKIYTDRGLIPIQKVVPGDMVSTLDGFQEVLDSKHTGRKTIYTVRLNSGKKVKLTSNHPVLVLQDSKLVWTKVKNLSEGMYVVTFGKSEFPKSEKILKDGKVVDKYFARLLGYMVSEGHSDNFVNYTDYILDDFKKCVIKTFGKNALVETKYEKILKLNPFVLEYLRNLGLKNCANQQIPRCIFESPKHIIKEFLGALYDGDGWITDLKSTYGSKSKKLAEQVQQLLFSLGIYTKLSKNINSGANKIDMWLVRTSSFYQTNKVRKNSNRLRTDKIKGRINGGPNPHVFTFPKELNIKNVCMDFVRAKIIDQIHTEDSNKFFYTRDLMAKFDLLVYRDDINSFLNKKGVIKYIREPGVGGKPKYYCTLHDFGRLLFDRIVNRNFKKYVGVGYQPTDRMCGVNKKQDLKIFIKSVPDPDLRKALSFYADTDLLFDPIVNITKGTKQEVYDLTVNKAEHFIVNGIVTHNCKHLAMVAQFIINNRY